MKNAWEYFAMAICSGVNRILLYGPPGTGKTYQAVTLAQQQGKDVYSLTLHEDLAAADLIGHWVPKGQEFVWHYGPAIRAWLAGAVLVLNEIDQAAGPVLTALYSILDDPQIARLTLPCGETVLPKNGFACIATMNGQPESLPPALLDRFDVTIHINAPHPTALAGLNSYIRQACIDSYAGREDQLVSLRRWRVFQQLLHNNNYSREDAAILAFGPQRASYVLDALAIGRRSS